MKRKLTKRHIIHLTYRLEEMRREQRGIMRYLRRRLRNIEKLLTPKETANFKSKIVRFK